MSTQQAAAWHIRVEYVHWQNKLIEKNTNMNKREWNIKPIYLFSEVVYIVYFKENEL